LDGALGRAFYAECARRGLTPPRVVSVSFAPYWILVDQPGGRIETPKFDEFIRDWMPRLEKDAPPKRRLLWGVSQGGFSAALLALRRPDLFQAEALTCPAIPSIPPFSSEPDRKAYAARRSIKTGGLEYGLSLFTNRLDGPAQYAPIDVVALAQRAKAPRTFIQANLSDEYGFFDGAKLLADALKADGASVEFRPEPGAHCTNDIGLVAEFLSR
jgi:predicted esterase